MFINSDRLSPQAARILPCLVAVAFFMQMLDATILNTALPGMARELDVEPLRMQSVVIAYMLTTALLMPVSGWLADRFGTRKIFVFALFLFSLGSLLCALSGSLEFLVGSRIVQGMGGALMVPVGRLVVLKAFPRQELVRVLSFVTLPACNRSPAGTGYRRFSGPVRFLALDISHQPARGAGGRPPGSALHAGLHGNRNVRL